jgi:hypothetical protein
MEVANTLDYYNKNTLAYYNKNTLAYYNKITITAVKRFIVQALWWSKLNTVIDQWVGPLVKWIWVMSLNEMDPPFDLNINQVFRNWKKAKTKVFDIGFISPHILIGYEMIPDTEGIVPLLNKTGKLSSGIGWSRCITKHLQFLIIILIMINWLPVSAARWQHGSQMHFVTFL